MIAQYLDGAEARFIGHMSELDARKRNGETFVVEIGMTEMGLADSRLFIIAVTRDVTERHRIARQLADTAERLQRFYDEQTIEQDLARSIMERQVNANGCAIRGSALPSCRPPTLGRPRAGSALRSESHLCDAGRYDGTWSRRGQRLACAVPSTGWRPVTCRTDLIRGIE